MDELVNRKKQAQRKNGGVGKSSTVENDVEATFTEAENKIERWRKRERESERAYFSIEFNSFIFFFIRLFRLHQPGI